MRSASYTCLAALVLLCVAGLVAWYGSQVTRSWSTPCRRWNRKVGAFNEALALKLRLLAAMHALELEPELAPVLVPGGRRELGTCASDTR